MSDMQGWHHMQQLEQQQAIEDAIARAECGIATAADFEIIRSQCGLTKQRFISNKYGFKGKPAPVTLAIEKETSWAL